jgi:pimeloyl-ACP methyl ester carboxylesterase
MAKPRKPSAAREPPVPSDSHAEASAASKDAVLGSALVQHAYDGSVEFTIDPASFQEAFAADLSSEQAAVMAATQRPVAEAAFSDASGAPAWKDLPSWAVVATADKAAGTDVVRSMAERAGATITELDGSHVIMVSQPQAVTDVILQALGQSPDSEGTSWASALVDAYLDK